jgi:hypothetical protein
VIPEIRSGDATAYGQNAESAGFPSGKKVPRLDVVVDHWKAVGPIADDGATTFRTFDSLTGEPIPRDQGGLIGRVKEGQVIAVGKDAEAAAAADAVKLADAAVVDAVTRPPAGESAAKAAEAARSLGRAAKAVEMFGRLMLPVAIAADVFVVATAVKADGGFGVNTAKAVGGIAGGWAGFFAGAATGAAVGLVLGGPVGALIGGIIGGIAGSAAGTTAGEAAAEGLYSTIERERAIQALVDKATAPGFRVSTPGESGQEFAALGFDWTAVTEPEPDPAVAA